MKMKNTFWTILMACVLFASCSGNDDDLKTLDPLTPEYSLPQGGNQAADERIVKIYNDYGSFILYQYTFLDFMRDLPATDYVYEEPDPQYVDEMLDFLDGVWFGFYTEKFHKKFMPYKIFLCGRLDNVGRPMTYLASTNAIRLNYCSDTLSTFTPANKNTIKNAIQQGLWGRWCENYYDDFPEEFFTVSDYSTAPTSEDEAKTRGFTSDWCVDYWPGTGTWSYQNPRLEDLRYYMYAFVQRNAETWETDLSQYPLIKRKYDILRNFFQNEYGFDITNVGNATFE